MELPVGFRFRPTEFEICNYFLKRKAFGQPMMMKTLTLPDECHDIFSRHPRDLPGYPREEHWYLYCSKRNNQVNSHNIWIPVGEETNVLDPNNNDALLVGIKRPFTLLDHDDEEEEKEEEEEEEEPPKYNWFMDEISLPVTVTETDWVLCHVFRKKIKPEIESQSEEEDDEDESVVGESLDVPKEKDGIVLPPSPH